jgi:hypothetical protein
MVKYGDSFKEIKRKKDDTKKVTSIAELKGVERCSGESKYPFKSSFPFCSLSHSELLHRPQMFDILFYINFNHLSYLKYKK